MDTLQLVWVNPWNISHTHHLIFSSLFNQGPYPQATVPPVQTTTKNPVVQSKPKPSSQEPVTSNNDTTFSTDTVSSDTTEVQYGMNKILRVGTRLNILAIFSFYNPDWPSYPPGRMQLNYWPFHINLLFIHLCMPSCEKRHMQWLECTTNQLWDTVNKMLQVITPLALTVHNCQWFLQFHKSIGRLNMFCHPCGELGGCKWQYCRP